MPRRSSPRASDLWSELVDGVEHQLPMSGSAPLDVVAPKGLAAAARSNATAWISTEAIANPALFGIDRLHCSVPLFLGSATAWNASRYHQTQSDQLGSTPSRRTLLMTFMLPEPAS